jgi:hypothetical protein
MKCPYCNKEMSESIVYTKHYDLCSRDEDGEFIGRKGWFCDCVKEKDNKPVCYTKKFNVH